jgi:WD40 repeat protein
VLSSDGNTFYVAAPSGPTYSNGQIIAVDRLNGKTLHTYHTKYPIWNPVSLALAPNQSRIYVDTCSSSADGSTCQGGNVEVLDVASGQNLVISAGTDQVFGIAAAPNGKTVYAAHYPNSPDCCFSICCAVPAGSVPPSAITAFDATSFQPVGSLAFLTGTPSSIVITPDSQTGFVASGGNVYQIALAQMTLAATIPVGDAAFMALSGDGTTLAAAEVSAGYLNSELSFINTATGAMTGPVTLSGAVSGVSIAPDGSAAYVTAYNPLDVLYVVSVQDLKVVAEPPLGDVLATVVSPNGEELYPLLAAGSAVEVLQQGSVTPSKLLRAAGGGFALSPDGQTLYSTGPQSGLWATSTTTGQVVKTMLPKSFVYGVVVSPDGKTLYALVSGTSVVVVNASTGEGEKSIPLPVNGQPEDLYVALALTPAGDRLYVLGGAITPDNTVVIDTRNLAILATLAGAGGYSLAINPSGDAVYIGQYLAIDVIQTATNKVIGTISAAPAVNSIAFSPDGTRAYAWGGYAAQGINVIDTATLAVTNFLPGTFGVGGLAVTPDGTLLYGGGQSPTFQFGAEPGSIINTQSLQITATFPSGGGILIH